MATENSMHAHAEQVAHLLREISTRTLNHFAEEAKVNGESLKDAFERYDIDYAWHVLGSDRMREETISFLEGKYQQTATAEQKTWVAGILKSAAQAQAPELLMSFDNEVPQQLAGCLSSSWIKDSTMPTTADACGAARQ